MPQYELWKHVMLKKRDQHWRTNTAWFYLYKTPRIDKYMETESRTEMTRGLETGNKLLFNWYRVSVCGDENIPEIDSGNGYTILWMCLMPLNHKF